MKFKGRTKWNEMQQIGKSRFVWRERALLFGVPLGIAVPLILGDFRPSSLAELATGEAVKGLWIPLLVGVVGGALYGHAEWDHERHEAEKANEEPESDDP